MAKSTGYNTENALGLITIGKTTYEVHVAVVGRRDWFVLVGPRNALYVVMIHDGGRTSVSRFNSAFSAAPFQVTAEQMAPFTATANA